MSGDEGGNVFFVVKVVFFSGLGALFYAVRCESAKKCTENANLIWRLIFFPYLCAPISGTRFKSEQLVR